MEDIIKYPKIQEHWLWKKNVPFLYDYLLMTPLKWPSLSFTIPPIRFNSENMEIEEKDDGNILNKSSEIYLYGQLLIYGSYTSTESLNNENKIIKSNSLNEKSINISLLDTPNLDIDLLNINDLSNNNCYNKKIEKPKYLNPDFNTLIKLPVDDDIIKICSKLDDLKENIILASKMIKGEIWIHNIKIEDIKNETFNIKNNNINNNENNVKCLENINYSILNKNETNNISGYGLEWGTTYSNWLLSGNEDSSLYIYDVNKNEKILKSDTNNLINGINDVCWLNPNLTPNIFLTVNHQGCLSIYDYRETKNCSRIIPVNRWSICNNPCVSISVHPEISNLLCIGSYDGSLYIIDLRYFSNNKQFNLPYSNSRGIVNNLKYSNDPVHRVEWHSGGNGLLLSSSLDGKVCIWDITKSNNLPIWEQIYNNKDNNTKKINNNNLNDNQDVNYKNSLKMISNYNSNISNKNEKLDGPDELIGVHSGHFGYVTDTHWMYSPNNDSWSVISTDSYNNLHVWSFNEAVFTSENDLIEIAYAQKNNFNQYNFFSTKDSIENLVKTL